MSNYPPGVTGTEPEIVGGEEYRIDHYFAIEADGEIEEGHIFCTPAEGKVIEDYLIGNLTDVKVTVEPGGEYDYSTEESTAEDIAKSIVMDSGFQFSGDDSTEDDVTYKILRFYKDNDEMNREVIAEGLTLAEAKAHCNDPETSSSTATSAMATEHTAKHGAWFDGYEEE